MAKLEEVFQCQLQLAIVGMVLVTTPKLPVPCVDQSAHRGSP